MDTLSKELSEQYSTPVSDKVHRVATVFSYLLIALMGVVFWIHFQAFRVVQNRYPVSPHYRGVDAGMNYCDDCHDYPTDMCEDRAKMECLECHRNDGLARRLRTRSVLVLCTECHAPEIYISYIDISGHRQEVDITLHHPYGMAVTEETYPRSLPLSKYGGITCVTCHDVHIQDRRMKMLRIYKPADVAPEDVKPLCHDCHHSNGVL